MCARGVSQDKVSRPYPLRESCQIPHGMAAGHLGTLQGATAPRWVIHGCAVHIGLKHTTSAVQPQSTHWAASNGPFEEEGPVR